MSSFIGTAGWSIPKAHSDAFPQTGTGLTRYATMFNAVEINSTFYRPHRPSTFERWRDTVPEHFRFSVKVPKTITHELGLVEAGSTFSSFAVSISKLGSRLGPLLLQLPPKLAFDPEAVTRFLRDAKDAASSPLVFEPRHPSWFGGEADALLAEFGVGRAGADPERAHGAILPGASDHIRYWRLHGSPRVYFSSYDDKFLSNIAQQIAAAPMEAWCIFDNTASGAAAGDALRLLDLRIRSVDAARSR